MESVLSLSDLQGKWLELTKQTKTKESQDLYWESLFPLVEKKFISQSKVSGEYDWLVLPCGLETSYYILLINAIKPKRVYFLGTSEFINDFLDFIIKKTELKPSQYIVDTIEYSGLDVSDVYNKIRNHLDIFLNKKVLMDLTRGKRIMSVGAGIVGAFFGFDLVYIDEDWIDEVKRGMPGTERLVMVRNPFEVFGDLELKEARDFLNHHNHGAALSLYKRIRQKIVDPRVVEIEELISESYMHWSSFNFKAAYFKMNAAVQKNNQYNLRVGQGINKNLEALKILNEENNESEDFQIHVIVDLYVNALRKAEVGVFEDAISRLYRVIELIGQYRLKSYGISTANADIQKYESAYKELTKQLYGFEKAIPLEIGLKDDYLLLFILEDYLLQGYSIQDLREMFGVIRARDMSIIAHGLQLAGEKVFQNMNSLALNFIKIICEKQGKTFSSIIDQHTFVKLR